LFPTLLPFLRLANLILPLLIVALLLSLLFPTLLPFLRLLDLLLSLLLITLLALLTVVWLLLPSLFPALLLFALALLLCRLAILLGLPAVILFLLTLLLALFARRLIFLTTLLTAAASSLRAGKVSRSQQGGGYRQRQSQFSQIIRVHQRVPFLVCRRRESRRSGIWQPSFQIGWELNVEHLCRFTRRFDSQTHDMG
jgi:hypothetical protein